jgi:hypothetical protein
VSQWRRSAAVSSVARSSGKNRRVDAPAVLGWQRWRELDEQNSLGPIRAALTHAAEAGSIERRHVNPFAHIVLAAVNEVALMIKR